MLNIQALRRCSKCGVEKPTTREFFYVMRPHRRMPFSSKCIVCSTKTTRRHIKTIEQLAALFWAQTRVEPSGCRVWTGRVNEHGYGALKWRGRNWKAHRVAWLLAHGEDPGDLDVLHKCDHPPCCEPTHLFLGTHLDNVRDMLSKKRNNTMDRQRGEERYCAKLTEQIVREARRLHAAGSSYAALGRLFGVTTGVMRRAVLGKSWRHVA